MYKSGLNIFTHVLLHATNILFKKLIKNMISWIHKKYTAQHKKEKFEKNKFKESIEIVLCVDKSCFSTFIMYLKTF